MNKSFNQMKVLITGGTKGIGKAIADEFHEKGSEVHITGRSSSDLPFTFHKVDFSKDDSIKSFFDEISGIEFDVVINNAGINKINPVTEILQEDWDDILKVNLTAPFLLMQKTIPSMKKNKFGRIVNISSIFGSVTKEKRAAYSASKFGLLGLTKACSLENANDNVLVNCLGPGFIDTELTRTVLNDQQIREMVAQVPLGRLGTPEEIAKAVLFLSSPENTFITGQLIMADGGFTSA